jgi:hypothetical protein
MSQMRPWGKKRDGSQAHEKVILRAFPCSVEMPSLYIGLQPVKPQIHMVKPELQKY